MLLWWIQHDKVRALFMFFAPQTLRQSESASSSQNTEERVMFGTFLVIVVVVTVVTEPFVVFKSASC